MALPDSLWSSCHSQLPAAHLLLTWNPHLKSVMSPIWHLLPQQLPTGLQHLCRVLAVVSLTVARQDTVPQSYLAGLFSSLPLSVWLCNLKHS